MAEAAAAAPTANSAPVLDTCAGALSVAQLTRSQKEGHCWINPWKGWKNFEFTKGFKWMLSKTFSAEPIGSPAELEEFLPVRMQPAWASPEQLEREQVGVRATWLGHAAVLFQMDGASVLCDPVFSERCSPSQWFGPRRYRPAPCQVEDLPPLHAVCVSHTHYDHMDHNSLRRLVKRYPKCRFYVPAGSAGWMVRHCGARAEQVTEMEWWQEHQLEVAGQSQRLRVVFTPTQHWSQRTALDRNHSLWGSWALLGARHRAFFGGDTAYCEAFEQIGRHLGPFHLAALPIGAYKPRSFMCNQHVDPAEAVQVHRDLGARCSLGIHWGTFSLASESYMDPPRDLQDALTKAGLPLDCFQVVQHGASLDVPLDQA